MVNLMPTAETCPEAWLEGAKFLFAQPNREAYNLIIEARQPTIVTPEGRALCKEVDCFLREHGEQPLTTVAGTIFPAGLYKKHGTEGVFDIYPNKVYPKIKKPNEWGRYAMRMVRRQGKDGREVNPLQTLVEKLRSELTLNNPKRAIYELGTVDPTVDPLLDLPVYEPGLDGKRTRGGPCLSHLSFKLLPNRRLLLTLVYRYHYYIEKGLGNLIGLAQLHSFVATEAGLEVGPLVCHSTYAKIDNEGGWSVGAIRTMLERCEAAARQAAGS